jgi:hypothetical protein
LLRGLLDTESCDIKVVRITRSSDTNSIRLLENGRIRELWGDPLLRYSNILDGVFHDAVVVCEADADCRFYSAVLDALTSEDDDERRPDVLFTHCGGKARLPMVIRALREVDVPVRAVADFDILNDEEPLRTIVKELGLEWASLEADWKQVKNAVDAKKPELNSAEVSAEIASVLNGITDSQFPKKARDQIQGVLRRSSPWSTAKTVGRQYIPSGQPSQACERLLNTLRAAGLYVVEVGELEGFVRTEGGHGPKWVNSVLKRDLRNDPELDPARRFVRRLLSFNAGSTL